MLYRIYSGGKRMGADRCGRVDLYQLSMGGQFLIQGIQSDKKFLALAGLQRSESSTHWGNLPVKKAVGVQIVPVGGCFGTWEAGYSLTRMQETSNLRV